MCTLTLRCKSKWVGGGEGEQISEPALCTVRLNPTAFETSSRELPTEKMKPQPRGPGEGAGRAGAFPDSPRGLRSRSPRPPAEPLNASRMDSLPGARPWEGTPFVQWSLRLGQHPSRLTCSPGPPGGGGGSSRGTQGGRVSADCREKDPSQPLAGGQPFAATAA